MHRSLLAGAAVGTIIAAVGVYWLSRDAIPSARIVGAAPACARAAGSEPPEFRITGLDTVLPDALRQALEAGAGFAAAKWREWLADDSLPAGPIDLVFIADADRFARLYNGPDVDGWTTTGFYRTRSHEAVVLWAEPWRAQAYATALHEVSHLLVARHLGPTPPWLNEGLAEHFETVERGGGSFRSNEAHLATLGRDGPVDLAPLLRLNRVAFTATQAERHYAPAWALVAFLLDSEAGRPALLSMLRDTHTRRCAPDTDVAALPSRYPGGLEALENDLAQWIGSRSHSTSTAPSPATAASGTR